MLHPDAAREAAEVEPLSDAYEAALLSHDIVTLDAMFLDSEEVLRFGISDWQVGHRALRAWRATATPVDPRRQITSD